MTSKGGQVSVMVNFLPIFKMKIIDAVFQLDFEIFRTIASFIKISS